MCREHHHFLKLCLRLLSNHLALALAGGVATSILGRQARPLRNLLFRLMDSSVPDEIQEARTDTNHRCCRIKTSHSFGETFGIHIAEIFTAGQIRLAVLSVTTLKFALFNVQRIIFHSNVKVNVTVGAL